MPTKSKPTPEKIFLKKNIFRQKILLNKNSRLFKYLGIYWEDDEEDDAENAKVNEKYHQGIYEELEEALSWCEAASALYQKMRPTNLEATYKRIASLCGRLLNALDELDFETQTNLENKDEFFQWFRTTFGNTHHFDLTEFKLQKNVLRSFQKACNLGLEEVRGKSSKGAPAKTGLQIAIDKLKEIFDRHYAFPWPREGAEDDSQREFLEEFAKNKRLFIRHALKLIKVKVPKTFDRSIKIPTEKDEIEQIKRQAKEREFNKLSVLRPTLDFEFAGFQDGSGFGDVLDLRESER